MLDCVEVVTLPKLGLDSSNLDLSDPVQVGLGCGQGITARAFTCVNRGITSRTD